MRYIPLNDHSPDQEWIDKANGLLQRLQDAPNDDARKTLIDTNSAVWGELKSWLLRISHNKCWFSEAKDCFNHWDVEHYRPKKSARDADGTEHSGYWWLAFDWTNLRICGNVGNRKKGTFFPLQPGCRRVGRNGDIRLEKPLLLDPADPDDPSLISFTVEGKVTLAPGCTDPWEAMRVSYSVERYRLDFPALEDKRKVIWNECWTRIQHYVGELERRQETDSPIAYQLVKERAQEIRKMIREDAELSSVARACILSTANPRVINLLRGI